MFPCSQRYIEDNQWQQWLDATTIAAYSFVKIPWSTSFMLVLCCRYAACFFSIRPTLNIYPSRHLPSSKADVCIFNIVIWSDLASEESNTLSKLSPLHLTDEECFWWCSCGWVCKFLQSVFMCCKWVISAHCDPPSWWHFWFRIVSTIISSFLFSRVMPFERRNHRPWEDAYIIVLTQGAGPAYIHPHRSPSYCPIAYAPHLPFLECFLWK